LEQRPGRNPLNCARPGHDRASDLRDILSRLPRMSNRDDLAARLLRNGTPPANPVTTA
jgi:hypothetical protein